MLPITQVNPHISSSFERRPARSNPKMALYLLRLNSHFSIVTSVSLVAIICGTLAVGFTINQIIQNVYFHPLSRFPGPNVAKATTWWSTYQQVIARRSMHHICEKLHSKYGGVQLSLSLKDPG